MNCYIESCDRACEKRNMCKAHYMRWKRNGEEFDKSPIVDVLCIMSKFNSKLSEKNNDGCIIWKGWKNKDGYGKFSVDKLYVLAHRFAYEKFIGSIPEGKNVLHICDIRDCCNVEHLYIGDQFDNMCDASERNRFNRKGEQNSRSKLSNASVIYMRQFFGKISVAQLARDFEVSESTIHGIKHGRTWKDI